MTVMYNDLDYPVTVYVFTQGGKREFNNAGLKNRFPYTRYVQAGFTIKPDKSNLPGTGWEFLHEVQPGQLIAIPLLPLGDAGLEPIRRGLDEKGWYLGELWRGESNEALTENEKLGLTQSAQELLQTLVSESRDH